MTTHVNDTDAELSRLAYGILMPGMSTATVEPWLAAALEAGVESVCLFSDAIGTPERTKASTAALRAIAPDLLIATDEEGGEVTRLESTTGSSVLSPRALGVIGDAAVTEASARITGRMLRECGINWTLAPDADINVDPLNPVIGVRSFGTDADAVAIHVAAFVRGVQSCGVLSSAKHFPGHGDTHVDSHESLPALSIDMTTLLHREVKPFEAAIAAGAASVMTGHLLVPALDDTHPATLSYMVTTELLEVGLGYKGAKITDAIEMGAVAGADGSRLGAAAVSAVDAGADVICIGAAAQEHATAVAHAAIVEAVQNGTIPIKRLREAAEQRQALRAQAASSATDRVHSATDVATVARAATNSLHLTGNPRVTTETVGVVRISATPGYAAGPTAWGVAPHVEQAGQQVVHLPDVTAALDFVRTSSGTVVVEVRDTWKSAARLAELDQVLAAGTDVVVVDFGWPMVADARARGWISTHGTGLLSSALAASVLTSTDPTATASSILSHALRSIDV